MNFSYKIKAVKHIFPHISTNLFKMTMLLTSLSYQFAPAKIGVTD